MHPRSRMRVHSHAPKIAYECEGEKTERRQKKAQIRMSTAFLERFAYACVFMHAHAKNMSIPRSPLSKPTTKNASFTSKAGVGAAGGRCQRYASEEDAAALSTPAAAGAAASAGASAAPDDDDDEEKDEDDRDDDEDDADAEDAEGRDEA